MIPLKCDTITVLSKIIGFIHLTTVIIEMTVYPDFGQTARLSDIFEVLTFSISISLQIIAAFMLLLASKKTIDLYIDPWLWCSLPMFTLTTLYLINYLRRSIATSCSTTTLQSSLMIGMTWLCWLVIFFFAKLIKYEQKKKIETIEELLNEKSHFFSYQI